MHKEGYKGLSWHTQVSVPSRGTGFLIAVITGKVKDREGEIVSVPARGTGFLIPAQRGQQEYKK